MKKILIPFMIMSFTFSQTFEIDGELSIESTTIDSLRQSTTIEILRTWRTIK